jgi:Na+/H+-dicarboxylate symporter
LQASDHLHLACADYDLTFESKNPCKTACQQIAACAFRESELKADWSVLGYPGKLFVAGLKMVVVPMIAAGMILSVIRLGDLKKIKYLGKRCLAYYLMTTFIAAMEGLVWVNIFQPGKGGAASTNGSCAYSVAKKRTLDTFLDLGYSMIPPNLTEAFLRTNILGIICFSLLFGFYINKIDDRENRLVVLSFFDATNSALMGIVGLLIAFTPFGVASLVVSEVTKATNLLDVLAQLGMYVLAVACGIFVHIFFVYPTIYFIVTRESPLPIFKTLQSPWMMAFATSSSAATLPVTITAVEARGVHQEISRFMLPLGATVNMDGTAIYFPCAVIFLANFQGLNLSGGEQVAVALVGAFVSIGSAPIPNAGLVYLIMIMTAIDIPVTESISFVLAIDWLMGRMQTMCNISGDVFGSCILHNLREKAYKARDEASMRGIVKKPLK